MDDPPVVKNSSGQRQNQYAEAPSAWHANDHVPQESRKRNRGLWIVIGILGTGLVLLFCTFFGYAFYSLVAKSKTTDEYRKTREQANELLPQHIVSALSSADPAASDDVLEFGQLLQAIGDERDDVSALIDIPRFVIEMENSGLGRGVGGFARLIWQAQLEDVLSAPEISNSASIVGIDWLIPNQEVRLTLVDDYYYYGESAVWLVYAVKKNGEWKLYDWRNVLQPMSESQYYALYSSAPPKTQDNYADFTNDAWAIYNSGDNELRRQAREIFTAYQSYQYPNALKPLADYSCVSYLLECGHSNGLNKLVAEMSPNTLRSAQFFKAKLAISQGNLELAYEEASGFLTDVGWHPEAVRIASRCAQSKAQKQQAAQWVTRTLLLLPDSDRGVEEFLRVASASDVDWLVKRYGELEDGVERLLDLIRTLDYTDAGHPLLKRIARAAGGNSRLKPIENRVELSTLIANDQFEEALPVFGKVLAEPAMANEAYELRSELVLQSFLRGLTSHAYDLSADKEEFAEIFIDDYAIGWSFETTDWDDLRVFLNRARQDFPELMKGVETDIAIGRCLINLERYQEAMDLLLPIVTRDRAYFLAEDTPPGTSLILDSLARASIELGRMDDLKVALNAPETAYLLLASNLLTDGKIDELSGLLEWYQGQEADGAWLNYYRSHIAFRNGDWELADQELTKEIKRQSLNYGEDPYSDSYEEESELYWDISPMSEDLQEHRLRFALRSGKLEELFRKLIEEGALDDDWSWALQYEMNDIENPVLANDVSQLLSSADAEAVKRRGAELVSELALAKGDAESAINSLVQASNYEGGGYADYSYAYVDRILQLAAQGRIGQLDFLHPLLSSSDEWQQLLAVQAAVAKDSAAFLGLAQSLSDPAMFADDVIWIDALQELEVWQEYNAEYGVDVSRLGGKRSDGLVLLNAPASQLAENMKSALADSYGEVTRLSRRRFPNSSYAFSADFEEGAMIVVGFDKFPPGLEKQQLLARRFGGIAGAIYILHASKGEAKVGQQVRKLTATGLDDVEQAQCFMDFRSGCIFEGSGWQTRLLSNAADGFDPRQPQDEVSQYLPELELNVALHGEVGNTATLSISSIVEERIPLEPSVNRERDDGSVILAEASVLLPTLRAGTRVKRPVQYWYYGGGY